MHHKPISLLDVGDWNLLNVYYYNSELKLSQSIKAKEQWPYPTRHWTADGSKSKNEHQDIGLLYLTDYTKF